MIHQDQQHWTAQRIKATTREVPASHVSFLSQPEVVTELILDATQATVTAFFIQQSHVKRSMVGLPHGIGVGRLTAVE